MCGQFNLCYQLCYQPLCYQLVTCDFHLGYSVPPAHHRTIWCRSTFGPRGPGLSNPTSFLRPALPMAPTTDNSARAERSVPRPNPATFLRDFTLYMTSNDAILWKRCLNHIIFFNPLLHMLPIGNMWFQLKLKNNSHNRGLIQFFSSSYYSYCRKAGAARRSRENILGAAQPSQQLSQQR